MAAKLPSNLKVTSDSLADLRLAIRDLAAHEVLVGFPDETADRQDDTGAMKGSKAVLGAASEITNASLGYIHDKGAPEANIPARPFMEPGVMSKREKIVDELERAAASVLRDPRADVFARLQRVGVAAVLGIKGKINEGVPPPLSERTLRERARKGREGAMWELAWRAAGAPAGVELAKPLVDTAQMRNAVSFVVRKRSARK